MGALVVVALVLVAALGATVFFLGRRDGGAGPQAQPAPASSPTASAASTGCPTGSLPVAVTVAPAILNVVTAAADRVKAADPCDTFTLTAADSADAATALTTAAAGARPAAWVSDSTLFIDAVRAAQPDAVGADVQAIASSPLVFAVPTSIATKAGAAMASPSWKTLVAGDPALPVRLTDPEHSTSGRLLLLSAATAIGAGAEARSALGKVLLGWSHSPMPKEQELFAAAKTPQGAIFPTSEQAVAADLSDHAGALAAVVPAEGTGRYDYSLTQSTGIPPQAAAALAALRTELTNDEAKADLTAAGFRAPGTDSDSGPTVPGMPKGTVKYLADPKPEQQLALLKTWTGVKTDARMLAMIDTSGSMKEIEGTQTRMALAGEAAQTAVTIFPASSQVGLWTFGINKGAPGQDWREIVPIRQLDESIGGKPQRQVLTEALPGLVTTAGGGTGLYDSLLAAYQQMVSSYVPGRVNSVILLTDGRNEKPTGLTLEQLLAKIAQVKDPNKPVVIVTVGMGRGVDTAALTAVSAVTGGKSYVALDPQDIKLVFIDALLSRDCTGSSCTSR